MAMQVRSRALTIGLIAAGALLVSGSALAATVYDIQLDHLKFGNLDQDDTAACGGAGQLACGPTAAVNSFVWLQNQYPGIYGDNLILDATQDEDGDNDIDEYDDWIATANALGDPAYMDCAVCNGGTGIFDFIDGKMDWIEDHVPGVTTYADENWHDGGVWPTWQFLYDNLVSGEDVEILVGFYDDQVMRVGGHYLTITSFHWEDDDMDDIIDATETAWIDFIDPQDGTHKMADIQQNGSGDAIYVDYGIGGAVDATWLEATVKESPIPEPATLLLVGGGLVMLGLRRNRPS